ncbi:lysozyme inhibitor LprI family protein [Cyanobium usitatum]|uniref:lysozyme inhibitor LprI family protein n=1 Tax=Cyanobium usitatum TaxID=2304190 RepID=UPI002AD57903|nr:lysozyme inhibitor LprI family protein [Cyanobium usitatum]
MLICRDAELTAIDGELRAAFLRLQNDASSTEAQREALMEDQRRWVESMDQCWRAQERMRDCVKRSQRWRLQHL